MMPAVTAVPAVFQDASTISGRNSPARPVQRVDRMERPDLEARTAAFAVAVFGLANAVREKPGGRRPADQLLDCATSVGANYRASARARSRDEFIAKLGIVNEEADETVYWLEFFRSTTLGDSTLVEELLVEARELRAIFAASCGTAKRNRRRRNTAAGS
jgi:four helix bundle protein